MNKIIESMQKDIENMQESTKEIKLLNDDMRKGRNEICILTDSCLDQLEKMRTIISKEMAI